LKIEKASMVRVKIDKEKKKEKEKSEQPSKKKKKKASHKSMHCLASLSRLTKRPPQSCLAPEVKGRLSIFFVCGVFSLSRVSPHLDCLACSQQRRPIMLLFV
jgi:hypothetical protein